MFVIEEELKKLPEKPGVYIMKDEDDLIIYVGKAINLKNRVRSYFRESSSLNDYKVNALVKNIKEFEYIVTDTELEALILECNLIKEHKPKYNILLKDDKSYPYIKITINEKFPRIFMVHRHEKDKAKYLGPFTNRGAVKETLELIHNIWKLRSCSKKFPRDFGKERPCLNFHIGQCLAPCTGNISEEEYKIMTDEALALLNGKHNEIIKKLEQKMNVFSEELEFEKAGEVRDQINSVRALYEKQKIDLTDSFDHDVIAFARADSEIMFQLFFIRSGKMIGREHIYLQASEKFSRGEIISGLIKQFYNETSFIPKEIIIESEIEDKEVIEKWLTNLKGSVVNIVVPIKGDKFKLVELAHKNAIITLEQFGEKIRKEQEKTVGALDELKKALNIDRNINRIEAYDISNIQGFESVASMIVFQNGKPKRSDYRKFKIKGVIGPDDYSSIKEVITRRFLRFKNEQKDALEGKNVRQSFSELPDIIFVDGGKGQISSVKEVVSYLNIDVLVAGMVKDDKHRTRGLIFNDKEINLKYTSEGFKLITRIQDEVHRFAIEYHRKLREKIQVKSILDDIPNIGETRKKALVKYFGSIEGIKRASVDELLLVKEINKKSAESIYNFFRQ